MSKPNRRRARLSEVVASYEDEVGGREFEFEVGPEDDPKVFSFTHPLFAGDDETRRIDEAEGDHGKAMELLGDQYDEFIAAGGSDNSLALMYVACRMASQETVQRHRPLKR